jgi:hypothetical protein
MQRFVDLISNPVTKDPSCLNKTSKKEYLVGENLILQSERTGLW